MSKTQTASIFQNGRSQAVRLPRDFRFSGDRVRIRRVGRGVLLEPIASDLEDWFAQLDRYRDEEFMPEGREQPEPQERKFNF